MLIYWTCLRSCHYRWWGLWSVSDRGLWHDKVCPARFSENGWRTRCDGAMTMFYLHTMTAMQSNMFLVPQTGLTRERVWSATMLHQRLVIALSVHRCLYLIKSKSDPYRTILQQCLMRISVWKSFSGHRNYVREA